MRYVPVILGCVLAFALLIAGISFSTAPDPKYLPPDMPAPYGRAFPPPMEIKPGPLFEPPTPSK